MTPETIHDHLDRQPFRPSRVSLSDCSAHEIRHSEMALLTRREVIIAVPQDVAHLPERTVTCDLLHVTRIEPINGERASRRGKTQR